MKRNSIKNDFQKEDVQGNASIRAAGSTWCKPRCST
jgi:hypothetical protein